MKKYIVPVICVIAAIVGCIIVNIETTESLSPLGTTVENYEKITEEFGEDFSEFIKDKAIVKIYKEDDGARVLVGNSEVNITNKNPFIEKVEPVFNYIGDKVENVVDKIDEITDNNNEEEENLDEIVDDFINWTDEINKE